MAIRSLEVSSSQNAVTSFLNAVYGWMAAGLAITAAVAYATAASPAFVSALETQPALLVCIFIAQLALVFIVSARVDRLAPTTAGILFLLYAALTGVTFSLLLLTYTGASIASAFVVSAGMFGVMAVYGISTKRNLSGIGRFCAMMLIGLILTSIVGLFWKNSGLQFVISAAGVVIFAGLTAWDAQRLETMALADGDESSRGAYAVAGALALYLDLINLFLSFLRLFGRDRK